MKDRKFSIIIVFVALAILGCVLLGRIPVTLVPSQTLPGLTVSFSMANASSRVVESEVTSKIESALARMKGVRRTSSRSENGRGIVSIEFDKGMDMQMARFEVSTLIRQLWPQLPEGVSYPQVSMSHTMRESSKPILTYALNANVPSSDILKYAEDSIKSRVGRIRGVDRIVLSGSPQKEWRLIYDSEVLNNLGITSGEIASVVAQYGGTSYLGVTSTAEGEYIAVRMEDEDVTDFDVSKLSVGTKSGEEIGLDRLVSVRCQEAIPASITRLNGMTSIYCDVYADEHVNQIELANRVRAEVSSIKMPSGFSIILKSDVSENITSELNKIYLRTGLTLLILLLFVAVTTFNLRYLLIVTLSLLLSMGVCFIFYYLLGIEIQLYSMAGITISLNLMIDNIIVMCDHYRRREDRRVITSIIAATLTTVGVMAVVFLLDSEMRMNLEDFVIVVIVNLVVSVFTALWLVPALMSYLTVGKRSFPKRLRYVVMFNRGYGIYLRYARKYRVLMFVIAVLSFGLPVFLIPEYSCPKFYNDQLRPWVDKVFGGTLRLFVIDVRSGNYFNHENQEPTLTITARNPEGSTMEQINELLKRVESFLANTKGIREFRTEISSPRSGSIYVRFTKRAIDGGVSYQIRNDVTQLVLTLGGGDWTVNGVDKVGFSNSVEEPSGSIRVRMSGYNYEELEKLAGRFMNQLQTHPRVTNVSISSEFIEYKDDRYEFSLELDHEAMSRVGVSVRELYSVLHDFFGNDIPIMTGNKERIVVSPLQRQKYDVWALMNIPFSVNGHTFKLSQFCTLSRLPMSQSILKENQQYIIGMQYDYKGDQAQALSTLKNDIKRFRKTLPMGYTIEDSEYTPNWKSIFGSFWLLMFVVAVIYVLSAIFFNSLLKPLAIIFTIPLSFIGVFLVFWLTDMEFDQGGFAAFILLSGISVNAAIYIINEYAVTRDYIKAFNIKIVPILLTVLSTILGFIPFLISGQGPEPFWFPLALGTIGGLLFSLIAIVLYLPLFVRQT